MVGHHRRDNRPRRRHPDLYRHPRPGQCLRGRAHLLLTRRLRPCRPRFRERCRTAHMQTPGRRPCQPCRRYPHSNENQSTRPARARGLQLPRIFNRSGQRPWWLVDNTVIRVPRTGPALTRIPTSTRIMANPILRAPPSNRPLSGRLSRLGLMASRTRSS